MNTKSRSQPHGLLVAANIGNQASHDKAHRVRHFAQHRKLGEDIARQQANDEGDDDEDPTEGGVMVGLCACHLCVAGTLAAPATVSHGKRYEWPTKQLTHLSAAALGPSRHPSLNRPSRQRTCRSALATSPSNPANCCPGQPRCPKRSCGSIHEWTTTRTRAGLKMSVITHSSHALAKICIFFRFRHRLVPEFGSPWESHNVQQTVTAGQAEGLLAQSGLPLQRWALRLPPQCLV